MIVSRLKENADFRPSLPLVIVGYLPQEEAFPISTTFLFVRRDQLWEYTAQYSVFATAWSTERVIMAFLSYDDPTDADRAVAEQHARTAGCWPHPSSVNVVNGVVVVILKRSGPLEGSC